MASGYLRQFIKVNASARALYPSPAKGTPNYGIGNIDLNDRPIYENDDGSISTVDSASFNVDGKEVLIPTVWAENGKAVHGTPEQALQHYFDTGEFLGKFDSTSRANAYAEQLHLSQERQYQNSGADPEQQKVHLRDFLKPPVERLPLEQRLIAPSAITAYSKQLVINQLNQNINETFSDPLQSAKLGAAVYNLPQPTMKDVYGVSPTKEAEMSSPYFTGRLTPESVQRQEQRIAKEISGLYDIVLSANYAGASDEQLAYYADVQNQISAKKGEITKLKDDLYNQDVSDQRRQFESTALGGMTNIQEPFDFAGIGTDTDAKEYVKYITDPEYREQVLVGRVSDAAKFDTTGSGATQYSQYLMNRNKYQPLDHLTDREKSVMLYYAGIGEWDTVEKYYDTIKDELKNRLSEDEAAQIKKLSDENPGVGVLLNLSYAPFQVLGYIDTAFQQISNKYGSYKPADTTGAAFLPSKVVSSTTEGITADMGPWGKFFTQAGLSMAQMLEVLPLGPTGTLAVMSSSAAGNAAYQAIQNGASTDQAFTLATATGLIELLSEKVSIDHLFSIKDVKGLSGVVKNALAQGGIEASEETVAQFAGTIADNIIMGDKSEFNRYVEQLKAQGYTEKDAQKEALLKFYVEDVGLSALGGFISGGVFGGSAATISNLSQNAQDAAPSTEAPAGGFTLPPQNNSTEPLANGQELQNKQDDIFYRAGKSQIAPSKILLEGQKYTESNKAAYEKGLTEAVNQMKAEYNQSLVKGDKPGFIKNEYSAHVDKQTELDLNTIAEKRNIKIVFTAPTGAGDYNGFYDPDTRTVYIAQDATDPFLDVAKHEVTHDMKAVSPEAYKAYEDHVLTILGEDQVQRQIKTIKEIYKAQKNQDLTDARAIEEIVANYSKNLFSDSDTITQFISESPKAAKSFFDAVKAFIAKIRKALGPKHVPSALEKAEQLWLAAFKGAEQGEATTKGVRMSLKDVNGIGLVLPNGTIADIDNYRDHGAMMKVLKQDGSIDPNVASVNDIVDRGGVRFKPDNGVELSYDKEPTEKQYKVIEGFVDDFDAADFYVDFSVSGSSVDRLTYKPWEQSTRRIMNDIKKHYKADVRYSLKVMDKDTLDFLDGQLERGEVTEVFRCMQRVDGKLYPPMAGTINGEWQNPSALNEWEASEEITDFGAAVKSGLLKPYKGKNGETLYKFNLTKGATEDFDGGTAVAADYAPYIHTSLSMLNDQFTSAYKRNNLVVVRGYVPKSEVNSPYQAPGAKKATGETTWHSGVVASQMPESRRVILSRYFMPVEVLSDETVARGIKEAMKGNGIEIPYNVVSPSLRRALEAEGVNIGEGRGIKNLPPKDSVRYSLKDSNGNTLTQEQAEFFKDSKVRDAEGNLLVVYHGTSAHFDIFNTKYGTYFTDNRGIAKGFSTGKRLVEAYLNLRNPYVYDARGNYWDTIEAPAAMGKTNAKYEMTLDEQRDYDLFSPLKQEIQGLVDNDAPQKDIFKWYDNHPEYRKMFPKIQAIVQKQAAFEMKNSSTLEIGDLIEWALEQKYDGLIINNVREGWHSEIVANNYVAFSPEQIKSIDNKNPTDNPDIRFSLKDSGAVEFNEDGEMFIRKPEEITMEQWARIDKATKRLGYDSRGAEDAKKIYGRGWWLNKDQSDAFAKILGLAEKPQSTLTEDEALAKKHASAAARFFGTTTNFKEAGFLTINGTLLDFSEKRDGGTPGTRNQDHRAISNIIDMGAEDYTGTGALIQFLNEGNIRLLPENWGIDLSAQPNAKQESMLRSYIDVARGEVILDINNEKGRSVVSVEYQKGTSSTKVLNDIRAYFKDGTEPQVSEINKYRYSLKSTANIGAENERLRKMNDKLKSQFKISKDIKTDEKSITKYVSAVLDSYDSDYDKAELTRRITELYDTFANEPSWDDIKKSATAIAEDILNEASVLNDEMYQQYSDLRAYLKKNVIQLPEQYKSDINGFKAFRESNLKWFDVQLRKGTPVDQVFAELSGTYPEFFDQNEVSNPADQIQRIADVMADMAPVYENPFAGYMADATEYLAYEIIDNFYETPQAAPTFADKQALKLTKEKIKADNKLSDLREKKNERISNIKAETQERIRNLLERERARREKLADKLVTKYESREAAGKERRSRSSYKTRIKKVVADISAMLTSPSDRRHVPEALKGPVAEFLASVDLTTNRLGEKMMGRLRHLQAVYQRIADGTADVYMDIDPDLMDNIESLSSIENKKVSDMTLTELETLYKIARAVRESIWNYNKTFNENERRTISVLGQTVMIDNGTNKPYNESVNRIWQTLKDLGGMDMLSSFEYFEELGGTMNSLFLNLRTGLDKKISNITTAEKYMRSLLGDTKVADMTGDKAKATEFRLSNGGTISLTPAQVMSLYLLNRQEAGQNHIYTGGIKQAPVIATEGKKRVVKKSYSPAKVKLADVEKILSTMTDEQKRIAEGISKFFTDVTAEWGNEVSLKLYGYKKFTEELYFPIVSDDNYIQTLFAEKSDATLKNMGFTKSRIKNANNPIIIEDVFDVYTRQADKMGSYNAFVLPLSDIQKVYNFKNEAGSVKQAIEKRFGSRANDYFRKFMSDINGGIRTEPGTKIVNWLTRTYKAASIGANLRVVLQQPTSYIRAAAVMDTKYLTRGFASKTNWAEVRAHSPIAQWRDLGYFSLDVGRQMKDVFVGKPSVVEKFMAPIGAADRFAWGRLWNAVKFEMQAKHPDIKKGTAEYWEMVSKRFSEIVDRTQVIDTTFHRSQFMRSQDLMTKTLTSFMSEPTRQFNMLRSALVEAKTKGTPQAKKKARRLIASVLASMIVNAVVCSLIDMWRDDKDDDKKFWEALFAKLIGEDGQWLSGNLQGQFTGMIPFLRDIFSLIEGYDVSIMAYDGIESLIRTGGKIAKYYDAVVNGNDPQYTVLTIGKELVGAVGMIKGIPAKNILRELDSLTTNGLELANAHEAQYAIKRLYYNIKNGENSTVFYDLLFKFSEEGPEPDKEVYDKIYNDLLAAGYGKVQISNAMKNRIKKGDAFTTNKGELEKEIVSALEGSTMFKRFSAEYQDKALDAAKQLSSSITLGDISNYGISETSWMFKAVQAAEYGIKPYEYILFKTALQEANEDGSLKQSEVIDALDSMTFLTDDERDFLFGTRYESDKNNPYD